MKPLPAKFSTDIMPEPFVVVAVNGRVLASNQLARTVIAGLGTLAPGSNWHDLLREDEARRFDALVQGLASGASASSEFRFGTGPRAISLQVNILRASRKIGVTLRPVQAPVAKAPLFSGQVDTPLPSAFLPTLAHALKSHLAAAKTATFLLGKKTRLPAESKEQRWLAALGESISRATELLDQVELLDTAVFEPVKGTSEPTLINEWLVRLAEGAQQAHPGAQVALSTHCAVTGRWWVSTGLVGRAVTCLLSNTLKFAPAGSQSCLRATEQASALEIVVSDQGAGLPDSETAQLFTPFFRGANARHIPGCGLGLAIARAGVLRLGGTISYRVAPGPRVEFSLRIPAKAER